MVTFRITVAALVALAGTAWAASPRGTATTSPEARAESPLAVVDRCAEHSVDECNADLKCVKRTGLRHDTKKHCIESVALSCESQSGVGVGTGSTLARDAKGACWRFSGAMPPGGGFSAVTIEDVGCATKLFATSPLCR